VSEGQLWGVALTQKKVWERVVAIASTAELSAPWKDLETKSHVRARNGGHKASIGSGRYMYCRFRRCVFLAAGHETLALLHQARSRNMLLDHCLYFGSGCLPCRSSQLGREEPVGQELIARILDTVVKPGSNQNSADRPVSGDCLQTLIRLQYSACPRSSYIAYIAQ
jgi:hypothetical protein